MSQKKEKKTKEKEKKDKVRLPVQTTLEAGVQWHSGVRELVAPDHAQALRELCATNERRALPPRERQNARSLSATPGLPPQYEDEESLGSTYSLLVHSNAFYQGNPEETLHAIAAPDLVTDLMALQMAKPLIPTRDAAVTAPVTNEKHMRYVHPEYGSFASNPTTAVAIFEQRGLVRDILHPDDKDGDDATNPLPTKASERHEALHEHDRQERKVRFFDLDPLGPVAMGEEEPYGMAPGQYKGLQNLKTNEGERFDERADQQYYLGEDASHAKMEMLDTLRTEELRMPASSGPWRGCRRGDRCIVMIVSAKQGQPEVGYVEREYMTRDKEKLYLERRAHGVPISVENDGRVGLCLDDLLYGITSSFHRNAMVKRAPREALHTFMAKEQTYAREYCLPNIDAGATGIFGLVPQFLVNTRQFEKRKLPNGEVINYWADVGSVFRPSLSEANTCLGAFKARPFAGPYRFLPARPRGQRPVYMPRTILEEAAMPAIPWIRFLRECHPLVLQDRVLLAAEEDHLQQQEEEDVARRSAAHPLPVAWLRRALITTTTTPTTSATITSQMTPPAIEVAIKVFGLHHVQELETLLQHWADRAFCTFERSVSLWLYTLRHGNQLALAMAPLALFFNVRCYRRHEHLRRYFAPLHRHTTSLAPPTPVAKALKASKTDMSLVWQHLKEAILPENENAQAKDTFVLWAVTLWRCAAAAFFDLCLVHNAKAEPFNYNAHLFAHTHDDLLTFLAGAHPENRDLRASDHFLFSAAPVKDVVTRSRVVQTLRKPLPWLALFYPNALRLCCAEELPDLAPALVFANPWYDTGSKKTQEDVMRAMLHLFVLKLMNELCQRRGHHEILDRKGKAFPVIATYTLLVLKCVLLGNLPKAKDRLPLCMRLRVTAAFAPFASAEVTQSLKSWMKTKRLSVWFLMREYFFYHVENSFVLENIFSDSRKWPRFKALVRAANAEIRTDLTNQQQAQANKGKNPLSTPLSWEAIERVAFDYRDKKGKAHYSIVGRLMDRHDRSLKQFHKLKKGRFEEIFRKKSRAIEKDLHLDYAAAQQWLQSDDRLYYCHLVAWYLAQRSHAETTPLQWQLVMETRWFKPLGMSEAGLAEFRQWIFEYYEYDTGDEGLKAKTIRFCQRNWRDYVIARVVCQLFILYREQTDFILPLQSSLKQVNAVRSSMGTEDWFATQTHVGRLRFCEGCHQWASRVEPCHPILAGELAASQEALVALKARVADKVTQHAVLYGERAAATATGSVGDGHVCSIAEVRALAYGTNANEAAICGFRAAYVDAYNQGKLYCQRGNANTARVATEDDDAEGKKTKAAAAAAAEEEVDPYEELALGRLNTRQWMKRHAKQQATEGEEAFQRSLAQSPLLNMQHGTPLAQLKDVSVLAATNLSCNNPLTEVDMLKVWKRLHGRVVGHCEKCGIPCEVVNANITEDGVHCGRHPLIVAYPDSHRHWLRHGTTRTDVMQAFQGSRWRNRGYPPLPCYACRQQGATAAQAAPTARFVEAYDFQFFLCVIPLCEYHFQCCSTLIPSTPRLSAWGGTAVVAPPTRYDHIMEKVNRV